MAIRGSHYGIYTCLVDSDKGAPGKMVEVLDDARGTSEMSFLVNRIRPIRRYGDGRALWSYIPENMIPFDCIPVDLESTLMDAPRIQDEDESMIDLESLDLDLEVAA